MKNSILLTITLITSLLFVQCKKSELLSEEIISTEKSLTNTLNGTSWEVHSIISIPKNVSISWITKNPKMNFFGDFIEFKIGRDVCNKHYIFESDNLIINYSNCILNNQNHQDLVNLTEGKFKYIVSDNGENMILKNNIGTEIKLRRVAQLITNTSFNNTSNNISLQ